MDCTCIADRAPVLAQLGWEGDGVFANCWRQRLVEAVPGSAFDGVFNKPEFIGKIGGIFETVVEKMLIRQTQYQLVHRGGYPFEREKIEQAVHFFVEGTEEYEAPILFLLSILTKIYAEDGYETNEVFLKVIKRVIKLSFAQHLFDPEEYVSHDYRHARTVADFCRELCQEDEITLILTESVDRYGVSQWILQGLVELAAFLHDCGYPHLKGRCKANHAMYSADRVDALVDSLRDLLGENVQPEVFVDFHRAILLHNADVAPGAEGSFSFERRLETSSGEFLCQTRHVETVRATFQMPEKGIRKKNREIVEPPQVVNLSGRKIDLLNPEDGLLGIEFTQAYIDKNIFHLLRVADNLDFLIDRLTATQREEDFLRLCAMAHENLDDIRDETSDFNQFRNELQAQPRFQRLVSRIKEDSFKHFGGSAVFQQVSPRIHDGTMTLSLISGELFPLYDLIPAREGKENTTVARYQLFRAKKAFESIFLREGKSLGIDLLFKKNGEDWMIEENL